MNNNVLIITNKEDVTVDFVIEALKRKNVDYYRFNTEDIGSNINVCFDGHSFLINDHRKSRLINISEFDSVYFRRPKLTPPVIGLTPGEQHFYMTEMSTFMEGIYRSLSSKYWLNSVFDIRMLENKPYQLSLADSIGLSVPELCISNDPKLCTDFIKKHESCIFKPLKVGLIQEPEGFGKVLYTTKVDSHFIDKISTNGAMPIYLQKQIRKEYDIRLTVVGDQIFGAKILSQDSDVGHVDWRKSDSMLTHERLNVPGEIQEKCLKLCKMFNLSFAAIDFVLDRAGKFWFLEINPNGQWAWIESLLDYPISNEIVKLLASGGRNDGESH